MIEDHQAFYARVAQEVGEMRRRVLHRFDGATEAEMREWATRQGFTIDGKLAAVELQRLLFQARDMALLAAGQAKERAS